MLSKLRQKWQLNGWQLLLVICTFALGGSLCGYVGRKLMALLPIGHPVWWTITYIVLVTLVWPICVLLISIPLGQFSFFKKYLQKMGQKMFGKKESAATVENEMQSINAIPKIAIFASGAGSNAGKIIDSAANAYQIALIVCNKPEAGVLNIASKNGIATLLIEKEQFFRGNAYVDEIKAAGVDFIVLAGFLWKIPVALIQAFPNKIINIHPALLPNYGGKGMYGQRVHEAVIANGDIESGITIHWVDEHYDHGNIILQAKCAVLPNDTAETLAQRIHGLEHDHYPKVVAEVVSKL